MRFIKVITLFAVMMSAGAFQANAQNWQIVPGTSVGPITRSTSEKELIKIFGARNVKREAVDVGEGETQQGTILFPNDPQRKVFTCGGTRRHGNNRRVSRSGTRIHFGRRIVE